MNDVTSTPRKVQAAESDPLRPGSGGWRSVWNDRSLGVLMFILVSTAWFDTLFLGRFSPQALGFRVAWAALLGAMRLTPSFSPRWNRALLYFFVVGSAVCLVGLTDGMGGVGTPYYVLVATMPLGVGIALPMRQDRLALYLCGGACLVGTAFLLRHGHLPLIESVCWMLLMMTTTVLADFLFVRSARTQDLMREMLGERARREAVEALALSEHRRAQAEKLALVGRLSAGVAHEINNPLAYVGSNVDFAREALLSPGPVDREELAEVLAETRLGLRHIQQIVSDLKGFSHMQVDVPSECSLAEIVTDAMKLASLRLKHVAWLHLDVPADLPPIIAVRQRLVQVVLNLLVNAGDVLETHRVDKSEIRITGRREDSGVSLRIEDNGPGFSPQVLARLFEPFFTTKGPDKGMGLGLNLSRELLAQFGGQLTASNRPGGGACLILELPLGDPAVLSGSFPTANTQPV